MIGQAGPTDLQADETVVFLPTCAVKSEDGQSWLVPVHAWVFSFERDSRLRRHSISLFARSLNLDSIQAEDPEFCERALLFLVDNKGGRRLSINLEGRRCSLNPTSSNGHSETVLSIPVRPADPRTEIEFRLLDRENSAETECGRVYLPPDAGTSVISDIDDTIKITQVSDRSALLKNVFCREFEPVPGMAERYRGWAQEPVFFHYVSNAPAQLYLPLCRFLMRHDFPGGSFHLRRMRWKDRTLFNLFRPSDKLKRAHVEKLLRAYPRRTFVLVGDTGERDPELFGEISRLYPGRVGAVYLRRSVPAADALLTARLESALMHVERRRWLVFDRPSELPARLPAA